MMYILYLVPHVPNPTKVRSHYQIRGLLEAGHHVTVATLERSAKDTEHIEKLRRAGCKVIAAPLPKTQIVLNSLSAIAHGLPLQAKFMASGPLMQSIQDHLRDNPCDVIHVEHLRMAEYGLALKQSHPTVFDAVDHLASLYEQAQTRSASRLLQLISRYESRRLAHYEPWLIEQFPVTVVISAEDQKMFRQANPAYADHVLVAPAGLSLPEPDSSIQRSLNTLVITGAMNYHPNVASTVYFVKEIFPLILRQRPDIQLQIVGANPDPAIQALRSPQIEVTGFVPSLMEYLQRATIAVAPTQYGSGIQHKVIEAFITQTPLVASRTALRGFDAQHNEHLLVADSAAEFADAVLKLLADEPLRQQLAAAGRRYVEQHHDLKITTEKLVEIYRAVIAGDYK